jgi:deoxyribonuclease-4
MRTIGGTALAYSATRASRRRERGDANSGCGSVLAVQLGAHVSVSGGIHTAIDRIEALGGESVQVFTQSPRTWRPTNHDPANFERFKARRDEVGVHGVVCHALYLINLASPDDEIYSKSVASLQNTLDVACAIEADAVVFHVGSHQGAGFEVGLERIVPALELALERCSETTWLLMEKSAGAGGTIGRSVDELAQLWERLDRHPRLGVCLDSCHLYVSGYDITQREELDRVLEDLDARMGLDRLRVVHVNDSKAALGSNHDRHENIGDGLLGEELGVFLSHPDLQGLPALLEVPGQDGHGPDADEVRKLQELYARATRGGAARRSGTSDRKNRAAPLHA